uniref:Uncharacterized protein n=1 Tax=Nelumbo nucifera TaxID=4432 RepID=A0A822XJ58_NELNU|nr:TPA_asm: hypothetical protein HUJ06_020268 [Nelumbo nucifera]
MVENGALVNYSPGPAKHYDQIQSPTEHHYYPMWQSNGSLLDGNKADTSMPTGNPETGGHNDPNLNPNLEPELFYSIYTGQGLHHKFRSGRTSQFLVLGFVLDLLCELGFS